MNLWPRRRPPVPPAPRANPTRIAILEWELFGIAPAPGSAAAFAVGLRRAFGDSADCIVTVPDTMSRLDAAEFAARYVSRASAPHSAVLVRGSDRWDLSPEPR